MQRKNSNRKLTKITIFATMTLFIGYYISQLVNDCGNKSSSELIDNDELKNIGISLFALSCQLLHVFKPVSLQQITMGNTHSLNLCHDNETPELILPADIKKKLLTKIVFETRNLPAAEEDKKHLISSVTSLYYSSSLNRCKLESLLSWEPFKIVIIDPDLFDIKDVYATFANFKKRVYIPLGLFKSNSHYVTQLLSHEFKHALDSYENEKKGFWIAKANVKGVEYSFNQAKNAAPNEENELYSYLNSDLINIKQFDTILKKNYNARSKQESNMLNALFIHLKESKYQHAFKTFNLNAKDHKRISETTKNKKMECDSRFGKCWPNKSTGDFTDQEGDFIIEFDTTRPEYSLFSFSDPKNCSLESLAKNLILNIRMRYNKVETSVVANSRLPEHGAYLEEFLGHYPKLFNYLFPKFTDYLLKHTPKERVACLSRK